MTETKHIILHPITDADREFLLRVYEASREIELSYVQWEPEQRRAFLEHQFDAQSRHYLENYPGAKFDLIIADNLPCGRFYVFRGDNQFAIMDITILPEFRRNGIATHLIRELQAEAGSAGCSIRIYLEPFNPSQKLFSELGFNIVEDDGVTRRYEWSPASL